MQTKIFEEHFLESVDQDQSINSFTTSYFQTHSLSGAVVI